MYLLGHEMEAYFPVSIPQHGVGLNMTVQSYCDRLDFGIVSAKTAMADTSVLTDLIAEEFKAFEKAVAKVTAAAEPAIEAKAEPEPKKPAARKAPAKRTTAKRAPAKRTPAKKPATPKNPT